MRELETTGATIIGKLMGFTKRWNPFSTEVFALVKVNTRVINVPIDYRQQNIIQREHPISSFVPLAFNEGKWEIISRISASDSKLFNDSSTVFL